METYEFVATVRVMTQAASEEEAREALTEMLQEVGFVEGLE